MSSHHLQLLILVTFIWTLLLAALWAFHADTVLTVIPFHKFTLWSPHNSASSGINDDFASMRVGDASPARLSLSSGRWQSNPAHQNLSLPWTDDKAKFNCWSESELHPKGSGIRRTQDIDAWDWMTGDGEPLEAWNIDKFIIRGLQSRIGYFMVGGTFLHSVRGQEKRLIITT